jgi:hypothetical protein
LKRLYSTILSFLIFSFHITGILLSQELSLRKRINIISADSIRKHVEFLGHDSLQGRSTGSRGERIAAQYIASYLQKYQITPIGDQASYFQSIPMHGSFPLPESQLKIFYDDKEYLLQLGKDYLLYKSGAQTFIPQPVPLVFVGYGIIAPEFDYNDYQAIDVEGKVVVFLSGEPPSNDSLYFNGNDPTIYSYAESKRRLAISRGAIGSILIPLPHESRHQDWQRNVQEFAFEDITLAYSVTGNLSVLMNPDAAKILFERAPFSLNQVYEMDRTGIVHSFELNMNLSFKGIFIEREFFASNVIGMYEGANRKPEDSYLIVSAHYDHLGIGQRVEGDSIYNGVLDNAIGVAVAMEIARAFSMLPQRPLHSIIFLFLTGEEKGLLGSTYYLDHPIMPLYKTIANLNIDGIAVNDQFNDVVGIGAELSTLGDYLKKVADQFNLKVAQIASQFLATESFARSDQIAFARAGVPSILISEGLDYKNMSQEQALQKVIEWYDHIYHTPFDDLNQPINYEAARQHCQLLFVFCYSLANSTTPPKWRTGTPFINERFRTIAEKR